MKFKGILLDIDNSLYDYDKTNDIALQDVLSYFNSQLNISKELIKQHYEKARGQINAELRGTASSHNRLLYFQRMLEMMKLNPVRYALVAYTIYWDVFLENIFLYDGVQEFLMLNKERKIGFVTDLTADVQHKKLLKLNLVDHIDCLVTSEETGQEKPHPQIFLSALKKLDLNSEDVCMVGDNYDKDIIGARSLGIEAFWLNTKNESRETKDQSIKQFSNFREMFEFFKNA